jgi:hypothetical protein
MAIPQFNSDDLIGEAVARGVSFKEWDEAPGYRFGGDGSVWSCWTKHGTKDGPWRPMRFGGDSASRSVGLRIGGVQRTLGVRLLILNLFVGPCPDGHEADSIDGDQSNLAVSNLRWVSRVEKRFWRRVVRAASGCWEWAGSRDGYGYGKIGFGGKQMRTH